MFEFDAGKLVIIAIVALIFIGPKELPRVLRQVGQAVGKIRRLGMEFQSQFMEAMREADLEEVKVEVAKIAETATFDAGTDPLAGIRAELTKNIEELEDNKPRDTALPVATDPLAEALRENPMAAAEAIKSREAAAPLDMPTMEASQPTPVEPALAPEPLQKRA